MSKIYIKNMVAKYYFQQRYLLEYNYDPRTAERQI